MYPMVATVNALQSRMHVCIYAGGEYFRAPRKNAKGS